jgi:hypothetical protein
VTTQKGISEVAGYFFSKTANGEIIPLTIMNLKRQFPTNTKFLDIIDMNFKYDDDLIAFDDVHKMLRINHLAGEMIKK